MSKPLLVLLLSAGILVTPVGHADEIKPQAQRSGRKPALAPATTPQRKPASSTAAQARPSENKPDPEPGNPPQENKLLQEHARDVLNDLHVKPEIADKLAKEVADPEKKQGAIDRIKDMANAAADLDSVGADEKIRARAVDAISRSKDPKSTANETVGEGATESFFGKEIAQLVPGSKRANFREVFTSLLEIQGSLELLGAEPDAPEVKEAIREGAQQGITSRQEARIIVEKAAHKVFDRQGFPGKPGQSLNERLATMVEEQKILQAELDARKAAKARADSLARQRAKARAGNVGNSPITQGAAGSTTVGRSVSSRVEVAVGGGKSNTSGAGTVQRGTGVDATKTSGTGGQNRADMASSRLAAGSGGRTVAGRENSGSQASTSPGSTAGAPAAVDRAPATPAQTDNRTDNATATTQTPQAGTNNVNDSPAGTPSTTGGAAPSNQNSTVSTGEMLLNSPGNNSGSTVVHYDTDNPNVGADFTYNSDNTYTGVVTVVTRDAAGNIVRVSETEVSGTWGYDASGEPKPATQTVGETTVTTDNEQGSNSSQQPSSNQQSGNGSSQNSDDDEDDDDSDDGDKDNAEDTTTTTETQEQTTEAETTTEESKEASTTPNPMDIGGGDPTALSRRSGGRMGNQEARRQQRDLALARFGGAAGPDAGGKGGAPTLLTPEEKANAEKALNMRRGAGVTNPNPLGKDSVTATDRDLKELHLRGNGGARGPGNKTGPAKPQDPRSPVGGASPGPIPSGGTRITAGRSSRVSVNRNISQDRSLAESAIRAIAR